MRYKQRENTKETMRKMQHKNKRIFPSRTKTFIISRTFPKHFQKYSINIPLAALNQTLRMFIMKHFKSFIRRVRLKKI